jgi:hypothetical protein
MLLLLSAAACVLLFCSAVEPTRVPVLIELFTSEGCSSCPPADRLLQQLDQQAIVLGEHVDYWDRQGWKDPFSSHSFTERQETYTRLFHLDSTYTPEMVVDGATEFVGSDAVRAAQEIAKAARRQKVVVRLSQTSHGVHIEIDDTIGSGGVMLAVADPSAESQVTAGENKGRSLRHVAVVRSISKIGWVKRGGTFRGDAALTPGAASRRIIVFVQESGQGRVDGVAILES